MTACTAPLASIAMISVVERKIIHNNRLFYFQMESNSYSKGFINHDYVCLPDEKRKCAEDCREWLARRNNGVNKTITTIWTRKKKNSLFITYGRDSQTWVHVSPKGLSGIRCLVMCNGKSLSDATMNSSFWKPRVCMASRVLVSIYELFRQFTTTTPWISPRWHNTREIKFKFR